MGRMSLLDIASYIGVGIEVVEPTVLDLCHQGKGKLINNSYLTPFFITTFLEELGQLVADLGKVSLSDLMNKHWLPRDYIKEIIKDGIESKKLLGCQIQENNVVTEGFTRREFARIRGLMRGITRPAALNALA